MADYVWTQASASVTGHAVLFGFLPVSSTVPGTSNTVSGSPLDWTATTNSANGGTVPSSYWFDAENFISGFPNGPFIGGIPGPADNAYLGILPNATITGSASIPSAGNVPVTVTTYSNQTSINDGAYTVTAGPSDTIAIANLYMGGDTYAGAGGTETISPTLLINGGHVSISGALNGITDIPLGIVTVGESYGIRPAGTVALENSGSLTVAGGADPLTIDFLDGNGNGVALGTDGEATSSFTLNFDDFQAGDQISLHGGTSGTLSLNSSNGVATVEGSIGNVTFDLVFTPPSGQSYSNTNFFISQNDVITTSIACFTAGTRIATAQGERPVEDLKVGDLVMTRTGLQSIRWIGHRDLDLTRHPRPERAQPVRILRDAFAPGMPARDLRLSPDHAVFWNGVLTHAKLLINGTTVVQETVDRVSYFHVELDEHNVLFAEKLRAESYLDTGNRGMFENAEEALILHPDFPIHALDNACAPMVLHGPALAAIRRHLLDRAAALGFSTTLDPGLYLTIGDRRIDAVILEDGRRRFSVPKHAHRIRLRSRSAMPCHLLGDSTDTRLLGAFIRQIRLSEPTGQRDLALDSAVLGEGWYPPEPQGRWTNGDALLDLAGPCILEITLAGSLPYPNLRSARIRQAA